MPKKLIVGLGNPGEKYEYTRHNVGFLIADALAKKLNINWTFEKKFNSDIAQNTDYILVKPRTYMNNSGDAVKKISKYFGIDPGNLIVIHDDVDIKALTCKIQLGKGSAGHNGVGDIMEKLDTKNFWRLRIGIGRPVENKFDIKNFVLGKLSPEQLGDVDKIITDILNI